MRRRSKFLSHNMWVAGVRFSSDEATTDRKEESEESVRRGKEEKRPLGLELAVNCGALLHPVTTLPTKSYTLSDNGFMLKTVILYFGNELKI